MSAALIDPTAIRSHVDMLHSLAAAAGVTGGILTFSRIELDSDGSEKGEVCTERFAIGDVVNMTAAIEGWARNPRLNLYAPWSIFSAGLPRTSKGAESHVLAALAFVGDLDADNGKGGQGLPLPAPYIIETSAGNTQPVFPLSRALSGPQAKPIAIALCDAIGADSRTKDISGLWRIPGTLNWPNKKKLERGRNLAPQSVKILSPWTGEVIDPDELHQAALKFAKPRQSKERSSNGAPTTFDELPAILRKAIASPSFTGEDQSETAAGVFSHLRRIGWDDGQIKEVVEAHPQGIGKRYAKDKDLEADLQRTGNKWGRPEIADPVDLWAKFDPPSLVRGVLPDTIEQFAFDQGIAMGADMSGVAVAALAVCAAAIPDKIQLQVKQHNTGWLESARLWIALVGPVSAMKSPIMSAVVRPLRRIDSDMARKYSEQRAKHDKLPADERKQATPPLQTRLLLQDTTIEAAQEIIKDSPDGLLCYQDEMSGWFGSMDKYSGARGSAKDRAFWLEAYNGAPYSVHRIGRGAVYIDNLSVSMLGGIQPEPIRKLADESMDDGLLQRILPVVLRSAKAGKDEEPSDAVAEYGSLIANLHAMDGPRINIGVGYETVLRFDAGAQAIRQALEGRHLELQSCEAVNRKLAAHIGKYNGIFARLCVVWHCIEHAQGELPAIISENTARRVSSFLHGFLFPHALAFYAGVLGFSDDHDRLTAVAGYILAHRLDRITNRDIQRGDRTMRRLERRDIESVFDQLSALGWIDRAPATRPTDPPHWAVNPAVHAKFADRAEAEKARRDQARRAVGDIAGNGEAA